MDGFNRYIDAIKVPLVVVYKIVQSLIDLIV